MPVTTRSTRKRSYKRRNGTRKRTYAPRRRYYRRNAVVPLFKSLVPAKKMVRTRMASALINYAPAATSGNFNFYLNSIYDPTSTAGTEQPLYYDEMAALYQRYKVVSCRYTVVIYNTTADMVEITWDNRENGQAPTSFRTCMQYGNYRICGATDENIKNMAVCKGSWSLKKSVGLERASRDLGATFGQNPTKLFAVFFRLQSANNINVNYRVTMSFNVILTERLENDADAI